MSTRTNLVIFGTFAVVGLGAGTALASTPFSPTGTDPSRVTHTSAAPVHTSSLTSSDQFRVNDHIYARAPILARDRDALRVDRVQTPSTTLSTPTPAAAPVLTPVAPAVVHHAEPAPAPAPAAAPAPAVGHHAEQAPAPVVHHAEPAPAPAPAAVLVPAPPAEHHGKPTPAAPPRHHSKGEH